MTLRLAQPTRIVGLLLTTVWLAGCGPAEPGPTTLAPVPPGSQNWRLAVTGMHCDGCASGLESELRRTPGVSAVVVSFPEKLALVTAATNEVTLERLTAVVAEAGFTAQLVSP